LVSSRANRGDLAAFLVNQEPQSLDHDVRKKLFAEVIEAFHILQLSGNCPTLLALVE